jgi:hypothetical protein
LCWPFEPSSLNSCELQCFPDPILVSRGARARTEHRALCAVG